MDFEEEKETTVLQFSPKTLQTKVDETNTLLLKEDKAAQKANVADPAITETSTPVPDAENVENLTAEVQKLKAKLWAEKQRADNFERRYVEVRELSEKRHQKLEETERRVYQLQASLNRLLYSMSDQFAELKMILYNSSNSTTTSGPIATDVRVDIASDNSDTSSSDSDFTFPAPASTSAAFSSPNPNSFRLIDLSKTEVSGFENWGSDKEGAFDDYF